MAFAVTSFVGCDSNDVSKEEISGEYVFETFQFTAGQGSAQIVVNLLDTLDASRTRLQLFNRDRFTLLYRFEGSNSREVFVDGSYAISDSRIVLRGVEDDEDLYEDILLPLEFSLRYDPDVRERLTASFPHRVNLAAYSPEFQGFLEVLGTIDLTLSRR